MVDSGGDSGGCGEWGGLQAFYNEIAKCLRNLTGC